MVTKKNKGKKVVLVGHLYENEKGRKKDSGCSSAELTKSKVEMGKFLLSLPKDLRRKIKFEADEKGFGNASAYICHILRKRESIFDNKV